ncbi:MAG: RNA-binding cell elongation regulator Jag/EloR [bacterium]|nr:RNA-binding cell elongation regulator Jag/EloR [bacterium]
MERRVEAEGRTVEEATEKALKELGVDRDRIQLDVLDDGKSGFLGFGSKSARVRAYLKEGAGRSQVRTPEKGLQAPEVRADDDEGEKAPRQEREPGPKADPDLAARLVKELIYKMEMDGEIELGSRDGRICLSVHGPDSSILIGRNGQTLEAIQYLVNLMYSKKTLARAGILVDVEDYRIRREQKLRSMALEAGEKAKRGRKAISIAPMNAQDRRIIHIALQDDEGVKTISRGEGTLKKVVVIPK